MKKILLSVLVMASIATNAQTTVKKVILHDYTGVKCQFCTDGTVRLEAIAVANPTNFIPVQIHAPSYTPPASKLLSTEGTTIDNFVSKYGYPCGTVDMTRYPPANDANWTGIGMNRGAWSPAFDVQKVKTAIASVSIDNRVKVDATTFEADIVVEFNTMPTGTGPISVNAFIIEDSIKATKGTDYAQTNFGSGPYGGASPLTYEDHGYMHNNVFRDALLGAWGKNLALPIQTGKKYTEHVTFTVPAGASPAGWVVENIRIVAFVAYNGSAEDDKNVINGEMMDVSTSFFKVGVENVKNNVEILSAYPNPAKLGSVVTLQFDIATSQKVTVNVYNSIGQLVATPYVSDDIAGGHSVQWKTGLDDLTAGTYIIEVSTAEGRQTQKITLQ